MKRASLSSTSLHERLRQHMLPAVLLQVIQPPGAINDAGDVLPRLDRACPSDDVVDHSGFIFEYIDDRGVAERSGVMALASAGRIEIGLVQDYAVALF